MYKRIFVFLALALALFVTPSWACFGTITTEGGTPSCTNTFSPGTTTGTYDFNGTGDGVLTVKFVTVLTTFTLTVTVNHTLDPFDPNEFPAGTVVVTYSNGHQDQYDFTGNAGGPNGVPVKGTDYKGLITLTLTYNTSLPTTYEPAFAHAPGDTTTFTEDILTGYSEPVSDPTMDGSTPGLSSVAAAAEPLTENDTFCFVSPTPFSTFSASQVKVIEVSFQLFSSGFCPGTGTPIRDKTARLSLSMRDTSGNVVFPPIVDKEEGNKFHWDNKAGLNEFDLSTEGLAPGNYTITVRSSKASPHSISFTLTP
jgi:hypothetical protein